MTTTLVCGSSPAKPQSQRIGVDVAESEITLILTAPSDAIGRGKNTRVEKDLVKNIRKGHNKTPRTLVISLWRAPDRARRLARYILGAFAPIKSPKSRAEFYVSETTLEGEINRFQAMEQVGTLSRAERVLYVERLEEYDALLDDWQEYERSLLAGEQTQ